MTQDYKSTLYLPVTDFPMRAGLPKREPEILSRWESINLFGQIREASKGKEKFILHDGPPYANGHLHIGHALNKILKDVIVRCQQMLGKDSNYVPGWDCHGLPIEWKIEEKYRKKKRDKDEIPVVEFRNECREFAEQWINIQKTEFKRMGVTGNWEEPYTTMTFAAEARIAGELGKFLMDGSLYRGSKPVMWSPVEKTALAEAEIEYYDHESPTIYVNFPILSSSHSEAQDAAIVIWTTTPWTMPGNRALAYGPEIEYTVFEVTAVSDDSRARMGQKLVAASERLNVMTTECGISSYRIKATLKGADMEGTICGHPLRGQGYNFDVPMLPANFANTDEGSGFVHIAPGHGAEDWILGIENNIEVPQTIGEDGCYFDHIPMFAGMHVYTCNDEVAEKIHLAGGLLGKSSLVHRYPHSWRSKKPLIFRNTAQWFISMENTGLREIALKAIDETRFVPESGQRRLRGMIQDRPDWVISRQRAWGVPITVFVNKKTDEPLRDPAVMSRILEAFYKEGADAWFNSPASRFLGPKHDPDEYEQVLDILDVWFDSGSTHAFVLEDREDLQWPASLYLEGTDQHRGWFHSSLLESCGTRGKAPYETVLTHGFVMAEDGQKMSKSLGNIVEPQNIYNQYGADILRLWVIGSDYAEDLRIGPEIIKQQADLYRRLRNTLRFLLGNLHGFNEAEQVPSEELPELELWVLDRLWRINRSLEKTCDDFQFHTFFAELHNFCTVDLSAFYLDIRKDSLYCNRIDNLGRRASRTVLDKIFNCLTAWLAPFICFTAEEAWLERTGHDDTNSVHLRAFPDISEAWRNDDLMQKWDRIRAVRRTVTGALELGREEKRFGSSLQVAPIIYTDETTAALFSSLDAPEIFITSGAQFDAVSTPPTNAFSIDEIPDVAVTSILAPGEKCERCYRVLPEVGSVEAHPTTCKRCADAADHFQPINSL